MDMSQTIQMFDHLNVAIVACNADYKVIYQNEKCKQIFKEIFKKADYIGCDIAECHSPEVTKKVEQYFNEYENKTRELDYYVVDEPSGKATIVNVPFYENDTFKGVVEFIFESSLR